MAIRLSTQERDAELNAYLASLLSGYIRIYTGTKPATPNTAASGTLLAELRFPNPAGTVGSQLFTAGTIVDDSSADATGSAGYYRILKSDGTTPVEDGDVAASGADMNFNSIAIQSGARVKVTSFTHSIPME